MKFLLLHEIVHLMSFSSFFTNNNPQLFRTNPPTVKIGLIFGNLVSKKLTVLFLKHADFSSPPQLRILTIILMWLSKKI